MSRWTSATDELRKFMAAREVMRQQAFAEEVANEDRDYRDKRALQDDERTKKSFELQERQLSSLDTDRKERLARQKQEDEYKNALVLRQTLQKGPSSREDYEILKKNRLDQGVIKKNAGITLPLAAASGPGVTTDDSFESLGGTEVQEQARQDAFRAEQRQAASADAAERDRLNRQSREDIARDAAANRAAIAQLVKTRDLSPAQKIQAQNSLRDDFTRESKDFIGVAKSYRNLEEVLSQANAASDRAAIFEFMRSLDPGSVVRETEQQIAERARGLPGHMKQWLVKLANGQVLTPEQRQEFLGVSKGLYSAGLKAHERRVGEYTADAVAAQIDPKRVIRDYTVESFLTPGTTQAGTTAPPASPIVGTQGSKYQVIQK